MATKSTVGRLGVRTESWTGQEGFVYTYEERMRAVKAYIASDFRTNRTIAQLGYKRQVAQAQDIRDEYARGAISEEDAITRLKAIG